MPKSALDVGENSDGVREQGNHIYKKKVKVLIQMVECYLRGKYCDPLRLF